MSDGLICLLGAECVIQDGLAAHWNGDLSDRVFGRVCEPAIRRVVGVVDQPLLLNCYLAEVIPVLKRDFGLAKPCFLLTHTVRKIDAMIVFGASDCTDSRQISGPRRTEQPDNSCLFCGGNEIVVVFRIGRGTSHVVGRNTADRLKDALSPLLVLEPVGI